MSKAKDNPAQMITQWSGLLNSFPVTVIVRIKQTAVNEMRWDWWIELYWESQHALDNSLSTELLMKYKSEDSYDNETEAYRFAERYVRIMGFQFVGEIQ